MTEDETVRRYTPLAYRVSARMYIVGAERDDVHQEALIGLLRAVRTFNPARSHSFEAHVVMCVRSQVADAAKAALRLKHAPLLGATGNVDLDLFPGDDDPVEAVLRREWRAELVADLARLRPVQRRSLVGIAAGYSYAELGGRGKVGFAAVTGRRQLERLREARAA